MPLHHRGRATGLSSRVHVSEGNSDAPKRTAKKSLEDLIGERLIAPGPIVFSWPMTGEVRVRAEAILNASGKIWYEGAEWYVPTGFARGAPSRPATWILGDGDDVINGRDYLTMKESGVRIADLRHVARTVITSYRISAATGRTPGCCGGGSAPRPLVSFADGGGGGLLARWPRSRPPGSSAGPARPTCPAAGSPRRGRGPRARPDSARLLAERAVVPVQQFLGVRVRPERGEDRRAARLAEHADVVRRAVDDRASAAQHRNFVSPSIFWAAQAPTSAMIPPRRAARC